MIGNVLAELLGIVQSAQALLREPDDWSEGVRMLRLAEAVAGDVPSRLLADVETFSLIAGLRTDLDACLFAAEQLIDAGVARSVVTSVLKRGAAAAEETLEAVLRTEAVAAGA